MAPRKDTSSKRKPVTKKKPGLKKAALLQCVQDTLAEITDIKAELDKLAQERRAMCRGDNVHVLHLAKSK